MISPRLCRNSRRGAGIRSPEKPVYGPGKACCFIVNNLEKSPLRLAIFDRTRQQNLGKRANAGQWRAYFMVQDRHDLAVELQWKQQPSAGHINQLIHRWGKLSGFLFTVTKTALA